MLDSAAKVESLMAILGTRSRKKARKILKGLGLRLNKRGSVEPQSEIQLHEVLTRLRERRRLADQFLSLLGNAKPPSTTKEAIWERRVRDDILTGILEHGIVPLLRWVRRIRQVRRTGPCVIEFFQRQGLLPAELPDEGSYQRLLILKRMECSRWDWLDECDQSLLHDHLSLSVARGNSERTIEHYLTSFHWLSEVMKREGVRKLADLRSTHIDAQLGTWPLKGGSHGYRGMLLSCVSTLFTWLCEEKGLVNFPILKRHRSRRHDKDPRPLLPDQISLLTKTLDNQFNGTLLPAFFYLAYAAGLRFSEAIAVRACDIDRNSKSLMIPRGKGDKPGKLPIAGYALDRIDEWFATSPLPAGCKHVFHRNGFQITRDYAEHLRRELINASGVTFRWHQLRTTFATRLAEMKVGPFELQQLLRHNNLNTILKYVKYGDASVRRAYIGAVDKLLSSEGRSNVVQIGTALDLLDMDSASSSESSTAIEEGAA